jgi:class 3 adenylate cyclase
LVNTTSRIRSACHDANRKLLISETLFQKLTDSNEFQFEEMGGFQFKGKKEKINLLSVETKEQGLVQLC